MLKHPHAVNLGKYGRLICVNERACQCNSYAGTRPSTAGKAKPQASFSSAMSLNWVEVAPRQNPVQALDAPVNTLAAASSG